LEKIYQIILNDLSFPVDEPLGQGYSTITSKMLTYLFLILLTVQKILCCPPAPAGAAPRVARWTVRSPALHNFIQQWNNV